MSKTKYDNKEEMETNDKGHEEDDFFLEMSDDEKPERELPQGSDPFTGGEEQETSVIQDQGATEVTTDVEEATSDSDGEFAEETVIVQTESAKNATDETYDELLADLESVKAERDKYKDQLIRKAADLDNYRKRVAREKEDQQRYGNEKFAAELLPVLDNMERALSAMPSDEPTSSIKDGVDMVHKQLVAALKRFGVEGFESKGTPFDPQKHEAIQQVDSDSVPNGIIIDEYQKGYFIHDRLLRPAMVSVSKNENA